MTSVQVFRGSSPRVRGKDRALTQILKFLGIIPAGAGKSRRARLSRRRRRDHPRGCGEKLAERDLCLVV